MAVAVSGLVWWVCVFLLLIGFGVESETTEDKKALISFLSRIPHSYRLQWNESDSVCNWVGVGCDSTGSSVYSLRLPAVGLVGPIPANTIGHLRQLRVLSLRSNALSGEIPAEISNLTVLRGLYLQGNQFSGEVPAGLTKLRRLNRIDLSDNKLSGSIPVGINELPHLTGLFLENNGFSGNLSGVGSGALVEFNVSNNNLTGSIPETLGKFPASSFAGNIDLCDGPLKPCNPFPSSPTPSPSTTPSPSLATPSPSPGTPSPSPAKTHSKKLSAGAIAGIATGAAALLILLLILLLCLRKRRRENPSKSPKLPLPPRSMSAADAGTSSSKDDITGGDAERNKLVFFDGGAHIFDVEDLLRASAEVLGKGSVGTSYKAVLEEGTTVVVKRLKDVALTKRDFESQLDLIGNITHQNVVPIRAFYFSKDEKLLVTDFFAAGSLSALLHGSRGAGSTALDWDDRKRIALSAARGLAHLHVSGKIIHGNVKSSNVLIRPDREACVSDFGVNPIFGTSSAPNRIAGYRAPEVVETRRVTLKSDVYSFGVLVLELLTGKAPNQASVGEEGIDLPRWVQSVVREEWTSEVFDVELMRHDNVEEQMVQLLQIGMRCVMMIPDQRPDMHEVVNMIEEINRGDTNDGLRQSSDDPSKESDDHRSTRSITP